MRTKRDGQVVDALLLLVVVGAALVQPVHGVVYWLGVAVLVAALATAVALHLQRPARAR
jgi:hypothetical protein